MEAAAPRDLSFVHRAQRVYLDSDPGPVLRRLRPHCRQPYVAGEALRLLCVRGLPVRPPLVPRRTVRSVPARLLPADESRNDRILREFLAAARLSAPARHGRLRPPHLLAERIQPDSWTAPPHPLRRGPH